VAITERTGKVHQTSKDEKLAVDMCAGAPDPNTLRAVVSDH